MSQLQINNRFNTIIDAVCYWLGYQQKIGRHRLIHEASLRYPIADTITAQGTHIKLVVLEKLHPHFKGKIIDLVYSDVVHDPAEEKDDAQIKEVFEFKLSKASTGKMGSAEHQRVFDDVVRLAYYHLWGGKDCYFLMCGQYEEFKTYFVGQHNPLSVEGDGKIVVGVHHKPYAKPSEISGEKWNSSGLYQDWFGFGFGETKVVEFINTESWGLKSFQARYEPTKASNLFLDFIRVKTTCMAITRAGENDRTHAAGIWKIEGLASK